MATPEVVFRLISDAYTGLQYQSRLVFSELCTINIMIITDPVHGNMQSIFERPSQTNGVYISFYTRSQSANVPIASSPDTPSTVPALPGVLLPAAGAELALDPPPLVVFVAPSPPLVPFALLAVASVGAPGIRVACMTLSAASSWLRPVWPS